MRDALPFALAAACSVLVGGCAPPPVVAIKPGVDFSTLGRVALVDFADAPRQRGSGAIVGQALEPYLLKAGYDLVERGQVEKLLSEQAFSASGAVDAASAAELGKILGVKAVVLGRVTALTQARSSTYLQTVQNTDYEPVYETRQVTGKDGQVRTRTKLSHTDVVTTKDEIPVTYTTPATVAFSARLVDATTGSVLWSGEVSSEGANLAEAAGKGAERMLAALKKAWPVRP
jgi:hypothetical protein